jgi:hypothetical protein
MKQKYIYILLITTIGIGAFDIAPKQSGHSIAQKMFHRTTSISSLTYVMNKQERIDGKMIKQISHTKVELSPLKVYVRQLFPKDGVEVLYVDGPNKKALINPNGFPWINLKLNPSEGIMRNDQHHTIFQSGFEHVVSILEFICNKYAPEIDGMIVYNGTVKYNGKTCHSISLDNPYFEYIDYTVLADEDIEDIAARYKLSEHMIVELNKGIKDYDDVKTGQVIKIPNDYSPKMLLYIDATEWIPLRMDVYDDQGLYEKYEYSEVNINPSFVPEEFTPDYADYGF